MNNVPEILEEPLLCSSRFLNYKIPLVSLEIFTFSAIDSQEVKGLRLTLGNVPKIQDGFAGPGTSLITEGFLCLRRRT